MDAFCNFKHLCGSDVVFEPALSEDKTARAIFRLFYD
jgi:hypothetical protein